MNDLFAETPQSILSNFDEFWERYPRKVGKGQARTKYKAALKIATHDEIMFGLSQQLPALESKEKQFQPHASTWLHGERWEDEPEQPNNAIKGANLRSSLADDETRQRALDAARGATERGPDCY